MFVEATLPNPPNGLVIAFHAAAALPYDLRRWEEGLSVTLKEKAISSDPLGFVVGEVIAGIQKALRDSGPYEDDFTRIERDASIAASSIRFVVGPRTYDEDLGRLAYFSLKHKEKKGQLAGLRDAATRSIVALDFQSVLHVVPDYASAELKSRVSSLRLAMVDGIFAFLRDAKTVDAALTWWRRPVDVPPRERLDRPAEVSMFSLAAGERDVSDPLDLRAALMALF